MRVAPGCVECRFRRSQGLQCQQRRQRRNHSCGEAVACAGLRVACASGCRSITALVCCAVSVVLRLARGDAAAPALLSLLLVLLACLGSLAYSRGRVGRKQLRDIPPAPAFWCVVWFGHRLAGVQGWVAALSPGAWGHPRAERESFCLSQLLARCVRAQFLRLQPHTGWLFPLCCCVPSGPPLCKLGLCCCCLVARVLCVCVFLSCGCGIQFIHGGAAMRLFYCPPVSALAVVGLPVCCKGRVSPLAPRRRLGGFPDFGGSEGSHTAWHGTHSAPVSAAETARRACNGPEL